MRLSFPILLATVPLAGLLTGCAMAPMAATNNISSESLARTMNGKAKGGQQPVVGATIAVYTYGTTGYGSTGTLLGTTTTNSNGDFTINYTCPTSSTPVYALSIGGTNGYGSTSNSAIVEGAALGPCGSAEASPFIVINEISTVMLATGFSHFFSGTVTDGTTPDHFGSPASLTAAVSRVNNTLIPAVLNIPDAYPNNSTSTFTIESNKIITLGNILADCVNSAGPTSYPCTVLFTDTTPSGGTAPTNVLEAMVDLAKNPDPSGAIVQQLYGLSGSGAFAGGLTAYPTDYTVAVSYKAPSFGLGVNTRTVSTLDIDAAGRVWFPSNASGAVGIAYFDPSSLTFSSLYTYPGQVRPEQVVIDLNGRAWENDLGSNIVAGFSLTDPTAVLPITLTGTDNSKAATSTALTVLDNDNLRVALVTNSTGFPSLGEINNSNGTSTGTYSYAPVPNSEVQSSGFFGSSLAGDTVGGFWAGANYGGGNVAYGFYIDPNNGFDFVLQQTQDLDQAVFFYGGFAIARGGYSVQGDGLCVETLSGQGCYAMAGSTQTEVRHPGGMALDGAANLWLADNATPEVQFVANQNPNPTGSNPYPTYPTSSSNNTAVADQVYSHGTNNGSTLTNGAGIGIDNTGNVWVSNLGCYGNGCTPSAFTLTEIIGAGTPTVNPVSAQVVLGTRGPAGTEPQ